MSWVYLFTAGLFEIGWPVGLKWAQEPGKPVVGVTLAVLSMAISGALLFLAQKEIALGKRTRCGPASARQEPFWSEFGCLATRAVWDAISALC